MRVMTVLAIGIIVSASPLASSSVPSTMSYQGVLRDAQGNVVVDGDYRITFRIYDIESGGTQLWAEIDTCTVSSGIFNAVLGDVVSLDLPFDTQYWLGLSVAYDDELSPRVRLTSAPYAHRAAATDQAGLPIGTVVAWLKSSTGTPSLPDGWVECNGLILDDPLSPYHSQAIPDLNGQQRFLRGASASGGSGGSDSHSHNLQGGSGGRFTCTGGCGWIYVSGPSEGTYLRNYSHVAGNVPPYFEVVWVVRTR